MLPLDRLSYRYFLALSAAVFLFLEVVSGSAAGLYNDADAREAALDGAAAAQTGSVLSAMDSNPAALASLPNPVAAVTMTGALLRGEFQQPGRSASL